MNLNDSIPAYAIPTPAGILRLVGPKGPVRLYIAGRTGDSLALDQAMDLYVHIGELEAAESFTLQFSDPPEFTYEPTNEGGRYTATVENTRFGISVRNSTDHNEGYGIDEPMLDYTLAWDTPRKGEITINVDLMASPEPLIHIALAWGDASAITSTLIDSFIGAPQERPEVKK